MLATHTPLLPESPESKIRNKKTLTKCSELSNHLADQKNPQKLILTDLFLGDEGAIELANILEKNNEIISIEIRGNNISALGFGALCQALHQSTSLKKISAEWNNIGSDNLGVIALRELLQKNKSIQCVDLRNNNIDANCAAMLSNMIRESSLQVCDLRWNNLGDEGAKLILLAIQENPGKVQVDISGNKVSDTMMNEFDLINSERTSIQHSKNMQPRSSIIPNYQLSQVSKEFDIRSTEINLSSRSPIRTPQRVSFQYNKENINTHNFISPNRASTNSDKPGPQTKLPLTQSLSYRTTPNRISRPLSPFNGVQRDRVNPNLHPVYGKHVQALANERQSLNYNYNYNPEIDIQEMNNRYQKEINEIELNHNAQIQLHSKLTAIIHNLEKEVDTERQKNIALEYSMKELSLNFQNEVSQREEIESNSHQLIDEIRQRDQLVQQISLELEDEKKNNILMKKNIEELRYRYEKFQQEFQKTILENERKFQQDLIILTTHNDELKGQIEKQGSCFNQQIHSIQIDNEMKCRNYEEQLSNAVNATSELVEELKKKQMEIDDLYLEMEERSKKALEDGKSEEYEKAQKAIFELDKELQFLQSERDRVSQHNDDIIVDLENKKSQLYNLEKQVDENKKKWRDEVCNLEIELQRATFQLEGHKDELIRNVSQIEKLQLENNELKLTSKKLKEAKDEESEKMKRLLDTEQMKNDRIESEYKKKLSKLENELVESKEETQRITQEYEKLGDMLKGNITKLISQTFNDHERLKTPLKPEKGFRSEDL